MIKFALYITIMLSFSLALYPKEDELRIATVPLDKTLKNNNDLRKILVPTLNRYSYIKQIYLKNIDRKIWQLYRKKEKLDLEDAIHVSKELKLDIAIIIHSEEKLIELTNTNENILETDTNLTNTNENILETDTNLTNTNENILETDTKLANTNKMLLKTDTELTITNENILEVDTEPESTNMFETIYYIQGIDIKTGESIYEEETNDTNQVNSLTIELIDIAGINYAKNLLNGIESPSNDIELTFNISTVNDDYSRVILTNDSNIYVSDEIEFNFSVNKDGYITILGFLNDDSILLLNPNDFHQITNVLSNESYTIPSKDAIFDIIVSGSSGIDEYFIFFTEKVPDWVTNTQYVSGNGFKNINKSNIPEYAKLVKDDMKKENKRKWAIKKIKLNLNELVLDESLDKVDEVDITNGIEEVINKTDEVEEIIDESELVENNINEVDEVNKIPDE